MIADKKKVQLAMARACMNVHDVAEKADMPIPTINNIMSGRSVKPATIGKFSKALGIDVAEILAD